MMVEETIGERIRKLREAKGWSQEDLAKACSMTTNYIGNVERGVERYTNPTISSITAIADALEVHPTIILYGSMFSPGTTFLQGTLVDPNNPLDVTELVKKVESLFPLSKDEKELLNNYREISHPKEKRMVKEMAKTLAGK
ncbi:MAG: HTH-type transcriptional regulator SinR [Candidatus Atribacteria bacterium ADurb.Bin276]|uniref:HTH-type transcriptional regulator SinR n=1 Tax=Candidatus Atribacter allofermentans TaxID=1852833 RepID=A0A1V5T3X2_9BACT|nr:MAG: HTH-type transcriptional regulator SinR [Candidatus Atribacteria bacterium ADurb.Bin276]